MGTFASTNQSIMFISIASRTDRIMTRNSGAVKTLVREVLNFDSPKATKERYPQIAHRVSQQWLTDSKCKKQSHMTVRRAWIARVYRTSRTSRTDFGFKTLWDIFLGHPVFFTSICHQYWSLVFVTRICHQYFSLVFVTFICHQYWSLVFATSICHQ